MIFCAQGINSRRIMVQQQMGGQPFAAKAPACQLIRDIQQFKRLRCDIDAQHKVVKTAHGYLLILKNTAINGFRVLAPGPITMRLVVLKSEIPGISCSPFLNGW
jgi:hypothetical protein